MAGATGMALSAGMAGAGSIVAAIGQSSAMEMEGEYRKSIDNINAEFAGVQAKDAVARGEINARLLRQKARGMIGAERSSFSAQGVDVNSGSAADVQKDTAALSALDAQTIRNNAFRESLGFKMRALDLSYEGDFAKMAGDSGAFTTLLGGGLQAAGNFGQAAYWMDQGSGGGSKGGGK